MPEHIIFPEWRKSNETTKYPFSERATLTNLQGRIIVEGTFLDAAFYPIGGGEGLFLGRAVIDQETVVLHLSDPGNPTLATGELPLVNAPDNIVFKDSYGRPAGILVSESRRLGIFQSWGVGTHEFNREQSEFCATVCFPTPEVGVRGIQLEDGTLFVGDVFLVGDDGVVFRSESISVPGDCTRPGKVVKAIRMDVVGDPLFRRRLCVPTDLFNTPNLVKRIRIVGPNQTFVCSPNDQGDIKLTSNDDLASDTVLRIVTTPEGIKISAVGSSGQGRA